MSTDSVNLKYFHTKPTEKGRGPEGIVFDEIFSIHKSPGGFTFMEECDTYFNVELPSDKAIESLEEAIAWIKASA